MDARGVSLLNTRTHGSSAFAPSPNHPKKTRTKPNPLDLEFFYNKWIYIKFSDYG